MRCNCCERVIKKYEKFYILQDEEIYCTNCLEEEMVYVYTTESGEESFTEDEVQCFENKDEVVKMIEERIFWMKKHISDIENKPNKDKFDIVIERHRREELKQLEEKLKELEHE